jgi:hypothetical protein
VSDHLKIVDSHIPQNLTLKELDWYWEKLREARVTSDRDVAREDIGHSAEVLEQAIRLHGFNPDTHEPPSVQIQRMQMLQNYKFDPREVALVGSFVAPDGTAFPTDRHDDAAMHTAKVELHRFLVEVIDVVGLGQVNDEETTAKLIALMLVHANELMRLLEPYSTYMLMTKGQM